MELFELTGAGCLADEKVGARLLTALDDDCAINLWLIPDLTPFLFIHGEVCLEVSEWL